MLAEFSFLKLGLWLLSAGSEHKFQSFSKIEGEVTSYYKRQIKSATEKVKEIDSVDKKTWSMMVDEEKKCKEWIEKVKAIRDLQVCLFFYK